MAKLLADQAARTTSRREMEARHDDFVEVSAEVGMLDDSALASRLDDDPDEALSLLVDLARATDRSLREQARALAPKLLLPVSRHGSDRHSGGAARLVTSREDGLELDIDATVTLLADAVTPTAKDLRWRRWQQPGRAYVLVVDASGSVTGRPLATALVTAAALASRLGPADQLAVVAFWSRAVVLRPVTSASPPLTVLESLFDLRGGDTTDLAGGLRAALGQCGLATGTRRDVIVLTDGLANAGDPPGPVAATAAAGGAAVHVLGLSEAADAVEACTALADAGGGRVALLRSAADAPSALSAVLA